jgi:hypothetical protein
MSPPSMTRRYDPFRFGEGASSGIVSPLAFSYPFLKASPPVAADGMTTPIGGVGSRRLPGQVSLLHAHLTDGAAWRRFDVRTIAEPQEELEVACQAQDVAESGAEFRDLNGRI